MILLARDGSVTAQEALSVIYGDPDLPLIRLIEEAGAGNPAAQYHLAGRRARGEGTPKNLSEAGRLLIASARQNFHAAQYALGVACLQAAAEGAGFRERETGIALLSCVAASQSPLAGAARGKLSELRVPSNSFRPSSGPEENLTLPARLENLRLYRDYKRTRKLEEDRVREMERDRDSRRALEEEAWRSRAGRNE